MITRIDPLDFENSSMVQIDSDAGNMWLAIEDVEDWASSHGFVRTNEQTLRPVLLDGKLRYRGICFRISDEERAAADFSQRMMIERAERLRGVIPGVTRRQG